MDDNYATAEVIEEARRARAEALRRWMSVLCRSLMTLFGTTEWDWQARKGE